MTKFAGTKLLFLGVLPLAQDVNKDLGLGSKRDRGL